MSFYYLIGEEFNLLSGAETITVSSENSLFPKENLYSDDQGEVFKFNAAGADDTVTIDLNRIHNGDMEDWTLSTIPDGWVDASTGSGAVSEENGTGNLHGGDAAMKLDSGGGGSQAIAYYDVDVVSGWACTFSGWIMGDGTNATNIQIRNIHTGSYLTSAGAWQTASVNFGSNTTAAYVEKTSSFTVESYSTCLRHIVTLRVTVNYDDVSANAGYADDFALWPHWDFVSVHGHNLGGTITPEARSSNDNFVGDDDKESQTDFIIDRPSFYTVLDTAATDRYARLELSGTNYEAGEIGLLVFGQASTLPEPQLLPYGIDPSLEQLAFSSMGGHVSKLAMAENESEAVRLSFRLSTSDYETFRDEIQRRSQQGARSGVIVSDHTNGKVHYGKFASSFPTKHFLTGYYDVDCTFIEDGFVIRTT